MNIIQINKTLTPNESAFYERAAKFKSDNDYLNYLLNLDKKINGNDDVLVEYYLEEFRKESKKLTGLSKDNQIDKLLKMVLNNIEYLIEFIPDEAKIGQISKDGKLIITPEDGFLLNTYNLVKQIIELRNL